MAELSNATKNLIARYTIWKNSLKPKEGVATIHADEVASKVATFYERIRTIIDWKEEHLMRRVAVIRKLKRRFLELEPDTASQEFAEPLVLELVRGGYFPNDRIEETKVKDVQKIIDKYLFILQNRPKNVRKRTGLNFYSRLLEIAACEIEETLAPSVREMALIDFMFLRMRERIKINEKIYQSNLLRPEEKDIQIYIAVQQALFKFDDPVISYNLLRYYYPNWNNLPQQELATIAQTIYQILGNIEQQLEHPMANKFYAICEKYDTPYLLLGDILAKETPEETGKKIEEPAILEELIKKAYAKRLVDLRAKIRRAAIYSTASIFVTKILSLLVLEAVLAKIFTGNLNLILLGVDVLVPTLLMAFLVANIKPPSPKNLTLAVVETVKMAYQNDRIDTYKIKMPKRRGLITRAILWLMYLLGFVISVGAIWWVFSYFKFPFSSIIINIIFIALILFTGNAIRVRSQELTIEEESGGVLGFISDILLLPITSVGRWIANKWKRYNAIVIFLNVLIDVPFSAFVEFLEKWRYFIKDKKEELR